jgi:hypothetical protein
MKIRFRYCAVRQDCRKANGWEGWASPRLGGVHRLSREIFLRFDSIRFGGIFSEIFSFYYFAFSLMALAFSFSFFLESVRIQD